MGHGHVDFGGYVVTVTAPGRPRMPNGIECELEPRRDEAAIIGGGRLQVGRSAVGIGPDWDARPDIGGVFAAPPGRPPDPLELAGRGPGLTPDGDDLIAGYAAGLALLQGRTAEAAALAEAAAIRTTSLSATLLRHAARGELPEPAHAYLERGSEGELRAWGHSSGRMLLNGLQLAGARRDYERPATARSAKTTLAGRSARRRMYQANHSDP
jgi:hypothetical protein